MRSRVLHDKGRTAPPLVVVFVVELVIEFLPYLLFVDSVVLVSRPGVGILSREPLIVVTSSILLLLESSCFSDESR